MRGGAGGQGRAGGGEVGLGLRGPVGRDDQHRRRGHREVPEQVQRLAVGPVRVLDDHERGSHRRDAREVLAEGPCQQELPGGRPVVGQERRQPCGEAAGGRVLGCEAAQDLAPRPRGRRATARLRAAAERHQAALPLHARRQGLDQGALARPRVTGHPDHLETRRSSGDLLQPGQLTRAPDHGGGLRAGLGYECGGPRRRRRNDRLELQGGGLGQDVGFERAQRRAGVDPQLGREGLPGPAERGQGLPLPARTVVGEGEQPDGVLPQRVRPYMAFEVGNGLRLAPQPELRLGAVLDGDQVELLQPPHLGRGPLLVGELAVGPSLPQAERLVDQRGRLTVRAGGEAGGAGVEKAREPPGVHVVGTEVETVAGRGADQYGRRGPRTPPGFEHAAQVGDVDLQGSERLGRRLPLPEVLDEPVGGHDAAALADEPCDHRALPRRAEVDRAAIDARV